MSTRRQPIRVPGVVAVVLAIPLTPSPVGAQHIPLAELLPRLVLAEIVVRSPTPTSPSGALSHVAHFSPIEANEPNNPAVGIVQAFNSQMATQFSTFPLGSSAGGFTYVFDESVGTFRRGSSSFGPSFAERAITIGRRKLSVGFNYQRTSYDTFEGQNLDDATIKFYLRHQDCCGFTDPANATGFRVVGDGSRLNPPFEGDIIEASLSLDATTHTAAMFANYGITDRWDVGLAVPFVRVDLDASVTARIIRLVTDPPPSAQLTEQQRRDALDLHTFEVGNPNATRTVQRAGHATGIGDMVVRTKFRFLSMAGGGLAAALDLRLPTGDEAELLGAGGVQTKFLVVASTERGRFGHHVNFGYTAAQGDVAGTLFGGAAASVPDEINYSGGVEFVASPRVTMIADFVGRTLRRTGRLGLASTTFTYNTPPLPGEPAGADCGGFRGFVCRSASFDEFNLQPGNLTLLLGTGGVKFNPVGNLLISGSVLFPLTSAGLRSRLTTVIGIDYAF